MSNSCYKYQDYMTDVTFIQFIPVLHEKIMYPHCLSLIACRHVTSDSDICELDQEFMQMSFLNTVLCESSRTALSWLHSDWGLFDLMVLQQAQKLLACPNTQHNYFWGEWMSIIALTRERGKGGWQTHVFPWNTVLATFKFPFSMGNVVYSMFTSNKENSYSFQQC